MVVESTQEQETYVLDVRDLRVSYQTAAGPVRAVNGISFYLRPGERLGLVGEFWLRQNHGCAWPAAALAGLRRD